MKNLFWLELLCAGFSARALAAAVTWAVANGNHFSARSLRPATATLMDVDSINLTPATLIIGALALNDALVNMADLPHTRIVRDDSEAEFGLLAMANNKGLRSRS